MRLEAYGKNFPIGATFPAMFAGHHGKLEYAAFHDPKSLAFLVL